VNTSYNLPRISTTFTAAHILFGGKKRGTVQKSPHNQQVSVRNDSPRFATVHINDGFENCRPKSLKSYINFQKCANLNTGCDVKKQHSQSELRAIRIYHLSQLEERLIKLLKQERPCLEQKCREAKRM
jgi:hypothetical protein